MVEKEFGYTVLIHINPLELPAGVYIVEVNTVEVVDYKKIVILE